MSTFPACMSVLKGSNKLAGAGRPMRKLTETSECSAALGIPKVALLFLTPGDMPLEEVSPSSYGLIAQSAYPVHASVLAQNLFCGKYLVSEQPLEQQPGKCTTSAH